jgi:RNA polymerase sigma factor (sigma-70 family)
MFAIFGRGAIMIDRDVLMMVPSYLARQDKAQAPTAECNAWNAFHRECVALIYRPVRRARARRDEVDDLAQDVWTAVLDGLPRYCLDADRGSLETWVRSIVSRRLWCYFRRRSRHRECSLAFELAVAMLNRKPGPELELEQMQQHERFHTLVSQFAKRLPERDGRILSLRFIELRNATAIARELGVTPGCVRDFLHRVNPELRAFLLAGDVDAC